MSQLVLLARDVQLLIAAKLAHPRDRAALCLALPPLGLAAMRVHDSYKGALFALAVQVVGGGGTIEGLRLCVHECGPLSEELELLNSLCSGMRVHVNVRHKADGTLT